MRMVDSELVTPTATTNIAWQTVALTHFNAIGLHHAAAGGSCS